MRELGLPAGGGLSPTGEDGLSRIIPGPRQGYWLYDQPGLQPNGWLSPILGLGKRRLWPKASQLTMPQLHEKYNAECLRPRFAEEIIRNGVQMDVAIRRRLIR